MAGAVVKKRFATFATAADTLPGLTRVKALFVTNSKASADVVTLTAEGVTFWSQSVGVDETVSIPINNAVIEDLTLSTTNTDALVTVVTDPNFAG